MSCECYMVGGPFIAEDPECEVHQRGGLLERISELEARVRELELDKEVLEEELNAAQEAAEGMEGL